jgi:hypothetical protein
MRLLGDASFDQVAGGRINGRLTRADTKPWAMMACE